MQQIALLVPNTLSNALIGGGRASRIGAHYLITLGFLLAALYCGLLPLAGSLTQIYEPKIPGGVSATLTFALLLGQCVRDIAPAQRSVAMGFFQATYGIRMTLGPIVTGVMIDNIGFGMAFFAVALLSLFSAFLAYILMKPKEKAGSPRPL
ncbi:MAG: MFS transporter [Eubacteriales bacterium]|nr:MFS transporter [Eubacteriales bacterium]